MKKILTLILITSFSNVFAQYTQTAIISSLASPVAFDWMSNGNYLITLKASGIQVYSPTGTFLNTFYDLSDSVESGFERGVLGVCVDPLFSTNHFVYVYYNHNYNSGERIRIVKFTESGNFGTNPVLIFDQPVGSIPGNHVGGNIRMHSSEPDKLYFTIGELATSSNAQMLTNPYGKVLRINTDGTIPVDNPFYDDGNPLTGNDDRIWSYGHRNPFDLCFSPVNDSIYSSENGASAWDEANIIRKGANYGWNICQGNFLNGNTTPCTNPAYTNPIATWNPLPALTGIMVYSSNVITQLTNHMLVAGNNNGNIYDCTLGNAPAYNTVTSNVLLMNVTTSLTTLKQGADGCIYAMKGGYTSTGAIYRICPTGLYVDEHSTVLTEAGIFPNPSGASAEIKFHLRKNEHIRISILDIAMKEVSEVHSGSLVAGSHTINSDNSLLQNGVYFCKVETARETQLIKMVVVK